MSDESRSDEATSPSNEVGRTSPRLEWTEWIKTNWGLCLMYLFGIALLVCTAALMAWVVRKGESATKLEEYMFGLILAVVTGGISYALALKQQKDRELEEERKKLLPFVRSALRRAAGISSSLTRLDEAVLAAQGRRDALGRGTDAAAEVMAGETVVLIRTLIRELQEAAADSRTDWQTYAPEEVETVERSIENRLLQVQEENRKALDEQQRRHEQQIQELERRMWVAVGEVQVAPDEESQSEAIERLGDLRNQLERIQTAPPTDDPKPPAGLIAESVRNRDYDRAIAGYTALIEREPRAHTNYLGRARTYYLSGNPGAALRDLEFAERLYPADPNIALLRQKIRQGATIPASQSQASYAKAKEAQELLATGDLAAARRLYEEASILGLSDFMSSTNRAMIAVAEGNPESARLALEGVTPTGGSAQIIYWALWALRTIASGSMADLTELRAAIHACSETPKQIVAAAKVLLSLKLALQNVGRLTPWHRQVFDVVERAAAGEPVPEPEAGPNTGDTDWMRARQRELAGRLAELGAQGLDNPEMRRELREVTEKLRAPSDPSESELPQAELSPQQLISARRYEEAELAYDQMIQAQPDMHTFYIARAKVRALRGDRDRALEDLDVAEGLSPTDEAIETWRQRIQSSESIEKWMEGKRSSELRTQMIQSIEVDDLETAEAAFTELNRLEPDAGRSELDRSLMEIVQGNIEGARERLETLIDHASEDTPDYIKFSAGILGYACTLSQGEQEFDHRLVEELLDSLPKFVLITVSSWVKIGLKALREARPGRPVEDLESYLLEKATPGSTSQDSSPDAKSLMGAHRYPEAIDFYTERIRISPKGVTLYAGRARAYAKLGLFEEAFKDIDIVEGLATPNGGLGTVRQEIEALREERMEKSVRMALRRNMLDALREGRDRHAIAYRDVLASASSPSERSLDQSLIHIAAGRYSDAARILKDDSDPGDHGPKRLVAILLDAALAPGGPELIEESEDLSGAMLGGWARCALDILTLRHPTNELLNRYRAALQEERGRRRRPEED